MQALCQWEVQRDESPTALHEFLEDHAAGETAADYAAELVLALWNRRERVDDRIAAAPMALTVLSWRGVAPSSTM